MTYNNEKISKEEYESRIASVENEWDDTEVEYWESPHGNSIVASAEMPHGETKIFYLSVATPEDLDLDRAYNAIDNKIKLYLSFVQEANNEGAGCRVG